MYKNDHEVKSIWLSREKFLCKVRAVTNELHQLIKGGYLRWTWREWHQECLKQMALSYKASTVQGYDGGLKKWLPKEFVEKYLEDINVQDIRKFLFEAVGVVYL